MEKNHEQNFDYFYVARQPIFDCDGRTYGYELLFRKNAEGTFAEIDNADSATINVVTCGFIKSQENINQTKRIFINFTENMLLAGAPRALPPTIAVIEVLEDIVPSPDVVLELLKLKQEGYLIAVDDFEGNSLDDSFLDVADIIKIDVFGKTEDAILDIFNQIKHKKALKLAEKVEDRSSYNFLLKTGFDLFQGYFFARPENLTGKKVSSFQTSKIRVLSALNQPNIDTEKIVRLVNSDPSITYRLLRLLNSAAFGFSMKIESIQHAVVLLGNTRMCYWLRMVVLSDLNSSNNPGELFLLALNRGRLLEELVIDGHLPEFKPESMFLFGMLSLLDVMLDTPFPEIFNVLPLPQSFLSGYTDPKSPLALLLQLLTSLENDAGSEFTYLSNKLKIVPQKIIEASIRANAWTDSIAGEIL
ncbi:MAG: HDOD domain-containing protein [Desulforhopalus sp.]